MEELDPDEDRDMMMPTMPFDATHVQQLPGTLNGDPQITFVPSLTDDTLDG